MPGVHRCRVPQPGARGERGDGVGVVAGEDLERDPSSAKPGEGLRHVGRSSSASATTASGSRAGRPVDRPASRSGAAGSVARANTSTRRPCAVRARNVGRRGPARAGRARAPPARPRTQVASSVRSALHRSDELNGTSSSTGTGSPGRCGGQCGAGEVGRAGAAGHRAEQPPSTAPASSPADGHHLGHVSRPVVSVPVLSVQTTSTLLTDSTAFTRCTSAPRRELATAPGRVGERDEEEQAVGHQAREHRRGLHDAQQGEALEGGLQQDRAAHQDDEHHVSRTTNAICRCSGVMSVVSRRASAVSRLA